MNKYIPLHTHTTEGSIGDSILKIKQYIEKAKKLGLPAIGISNHGSLSDMYSFYTECINNDIKPIIGCEVYVTKNRLEKEKGYNHLVLIAKNNKGFENLLDIVSDASLNGFYYKPRTDLTYLKQKGEGIIALSACVAGHIPQLLLKRQKEDQDEVLSIINSLLSKSNDPITKEVIDTVELYKEIFDEFYLEIQPGNFTEQQIVNSNLVRLSKITNTPLVATNDIHYLNQEDYVIHDSFLKMHRKETKKDNENLIYPDKCYYFMDYNTILNSIADIDKSILKEAINNSVKIADKCNLDIINNSLYMPKFTTTESCESVHLRKLCYNQLSIIENDIEDPAEYYERVEYELSVLDKLGFCGYFLTVMDYIEHAEKEGIKVGPGRGSVNGSLVAYLIGITKVDPIKYNLLFERFLSEHRTSAPDVDIDFMSSRRKEMFDYVINKYGMDKCALVSTLQYRKAKGALRDAANLHNIPLELADIAAKLIPQVYYGDNGDKQTDLSIEDSLMVVPELREIKSHNQEWFDTAMKIEGLPKSPGVHAAGTLIAPISLKKKIPLIRKNEKDDDENIDNINATSLTLKDCETAKMIKFDFLGIASLDVISMIEKDTGYEFDYLNNDFNDSNIWSLIGSKNTTGLFQIGSKTYKERMHILCPTTIQQLAACLALVRGPCISSGADKKYMNIIQEKEEIELIHPLYDNVTHRTNGILIYQEQLMQICVNFGFSIETSYDIMKMVSKKNMKKLIAYEGEFRELAVNNNVDIEATNKIWQIMLDAGLYAFNESHAVAYAMLCYATAYFKFYHTSEFLCHSLTNAYSKTSAERKAAIMDIIEDCRNYGIKFLSPNINKSNWNCSLEDDKIRLGMCAIKGFGYKAYEAIEAKRPYIDFNDFYERVEKGECNKKAVTALIFANAFEDSGVVLDIYKDYYKNLNLNSKSKKEIKMEETIKPSNTESFNIYDPMDVIEECILGCSIISNPANDFEPIGFNNLKMNTKFNTKGIIRKVKKIKDKNKNQMCFLTIETGDGYIECTMFAETYKAHNGKGLYNKNKIVSFVGTKKQEGTCIINAIEAA